LRSTRYLLQPENENFDQHIRKVQNSNTKMISGREKSFAGGVLWNATVGVFLVPQLAIRPSRAVLQHERKRAPPLEGTTGRHCVFFGLAITCGAAAIRTRRCFETRCMLAYTSAALTHPETKRACHRFYCVRIREDGLTL
jgi:hypothetical protein